MTQAVVKGPIGEEATVLGTTGHQVFRWLWLQGCRTRSFCQGLVACGQSRGSEWEDGRGWAIRPTGVSLLMLLSWGLQMGDLGAEESESCTPNSPGQLERQA